jgi:CRP-like cAMP-binding protein
MSSSSEEFVSFSQGPPYRLQLSDDEARLIASLPITERFHPAGTMLVEEDMASQANLFVVAGWALSYKSMATGHRVITDLLQRGDFISAHEATGRAHRSVQAKTDVIVFELDARRALESTRLASLTLLLMARNYCIVEEHVANVSRRAPLERLVWLLLETAFRYEQAGSGPSARFTLPITQLDLADALGLTAIHVNRVLRVLREKGWLRFQRWSVEILQKAQLIETTGFNPSHLAMTPKEGVETGH